MFAVLLKALSFVVVIAIAYISKEKGAFSNTDYKIITKIALNITLPMAIIKSFATFEKDSTLFILAALGFFYAIFMWLLGLVLSLKKDHNEKVNYMLSLPCFNIGSFTMPFVQSFVGSYGVVATCMFDIGNAIMSSGGSYALTSSYLNPNSDKKAQIKDILKKLSSSIPFMTYFIMLIIAFSGIKIPEAVISLTGTIASANGFMAMFMLGLMLDLKIDKSSIKKILGALIVRYAVCVVFALAFYFLSPFPLVVRQILVLIMFSPTSALVPAFTQMCDGDMHAASFSNSLSIVVSVIIMTVLITFLNI